MNKLRMGVIGLGNRGFHAIQHTLLKIDDVEVTAVCDEYEDRVENAAAEVNAATGKVPFKTTDYTKVLERSDVDAVLVSTAWESHIEIAAAAMEAGKITALEVGGAYSIDDCWNLVRTYERTKTPIMFMENCCYDKAELLATSMARAGLFGEIVHCQGAYAHDLRYEILTGKENRHYRLRNYIHRNCDNYPTHDLGPIAKLLNINRGNKMVSLVTVASKAAGLRDYVRNNIGKLDKSLLEVDFRQGDIVHTLITCNNGETILLKLDTTLPRFYARDFTVRGTKGFYEQNTNTVFIEGIHKEEFWHTPDSYRCLLNNAVEFEDKYLPAIWKEATAEDLSSGHGGMDAFVFKAFVKAALNNEEMPIDVYDAASWMSISCLSEESIRHMGRPMSIPDFTNGKWITRPPKDVVEININ
ncbi:MAG TPA: Gfo/Idh/MocA family oxidoreductase [Clostridiaceae bacterium]|jgi:hypothetical protein|nr:Gfo/Idh/MocA family oxidoreductase [Clostridiaceae bacterium]HOA32402.1 Gfo/Idh/MocA family oxidoreductase [Clostridia bacterium]